MLRIIAENKRVPVRQPVRHAVKVSDKPENDRKKANLYVGSIFDFILL